LLYGKAIRQKIIEFNTFCKVGNSKIALLRVYFCAKTSIFVFLCKIILLWFIFNLLLLYNLLIYRRLGMTKTVFLCYFYILCSFLLQNMVFLFQFVTTGYCVICITRVCRIKYTRKRENAVFRVLTAENVFKVHLYRFLCFRAK